MLKQKKPYNLYFSADKLVELKKRAKDQDVPLSTYIKTKLFKEKQEEKQS